MEVWKFCENYEIIYFPNMQTLLPVKILQFLAAEMIFFFSPPDNNAIEKII